MSQRLSAITLLGMLLAGCQSASAPTAVDNSPWQDAKARGVVFRGVGNESGWWLEVGAGVAPTLTATLDYGQRTLQVDQWRVEADGPGFAGTADDGAAVRLSLSRAVCSDGMSDERNEVGANLTFDERRYAGCGGFLAQ